MHLSALEIGGIVLCSGMFGGYACDERCYGLQLSKPHCPTENANLSPISVISHVTHLVTGVPSVLSF